MHLRKDGEKTVIEDSDGVVITVAWFEIDILARIAYIHIELGQGFRLHKVRALRRLLRETPTKYNTIIATCLPGKNSRFAEFFGFRYITDVDRGYRLYGGPTHLDNGLLSRVFRA